MGSRVLVRAGHPQRKSVIGAAFGGGDGDGGGGKGDDAASLNGGGVSDHGLPAAVNIAFGT